MILNLRCVARPMPPHRLPGSLPFAPQGWTSGKGSTTVHTAICAGHTRSTIKPLHQDLRKSLRGEAGADLRAADLLVLRNVLGFPRYCTLVEFGGPTLVLR